MHHAQCNLRGSEAAPEGPGVLGQVGINENGKQRREQTGSSPTPMSPSSHFKLVWEQYFPSLKKGFYDLKFEDNCLILWIA